MNSTKSLRLLALTLLAAVAALAIPSAASAGPRQLSVMQDDAELLGPSAVDPAASMAEMKALGVDVVRTNIVFFNVYRGSEARRRPAGFDAANPNSSRYDWSRWDRLVDLAEQNGIKVLMTVTGPGPSFTSQAPSACPRRPPCTFRPQPAEFGKFTAAVAKRYRGRVDYYSLYNEPNLREWVTPQQTRPGGRRVQTEAAIYRKLWRAGYKSIARNDPGRRNRVLFGEVAAIGEPLSLIRAALCLDESGDRFRGSLARKHGCTGRPARLNVGGFAIHPYNAGAYGNPQSRLKGRNTQTSLPIAYLPRLHKVIDGAARKRQIRRRAPIFVTEFGFQTSPPDRFGPSLAQQARYINESDRLFWGNRRVAMVSQYELADAESRSVFNSGLRFADVRGRREKPSYDAYRLPIVVTRRSSRSVEAWGQVRPGGRATVQLQAARGGRSFRRVRNVRTNSRGYFRVSVRRSDAARLRYRISWQDPDADFHTSRVAKAGKRLRYYRN